MGKTQPVHRPCVAHQRCGVQVTEHRVVLDPGHVPIVSFRAGPVACGEAGFHYVGIRTALRESTIRPIRSFVLNGVREFPVLLSGKTMVVTGGNSGIGEAIVLAAAAEGANVVIDYVTHPEETTALIGKIEAAGGHAVGVQADVSKAADLQAMVKTAVDTYGRLDALVNNAGMETRTSILDTTEEDYERVLDINLKSAFFGTQFAARQFIAQGGGGIVINISSVHEDWPMPGNTAYCVSKGGMRMLTRTAGVELGGHGIRVVNVGPGAVSTPINASTMSDPAKLKALDAAIPLGRMAQPAEIADMVVFLASGKAAYMTASTVFLDGGIMQGSVGL
jgi:glucose 1-dehydrogenase